MGIVVSDEVSFRVNEDLILKGIKFGSETKDRLSENEADDESRQALHGSILIEYDTLRSVLSELARVFVVGPASQSEAA